MKREKIRSGFGFTLIELLVVIGILAILLSIVLIAINPFEQIAKAGDVKKQAAVYDLMNIADIKYVEDKAFPWEANVKCEEEIDEGGKLSSMMGCLSTLINKSEEDINDDDLDKYDDIYMYSCDDEKDDTDDNSVVMCFPANSKKSKIATNAIYDKYGNIKQGCPRTDDNNEYSDCYWCRNTNNKKQCPILSPSPIPSNTPTQTSSLATPTPTPDYNTLYGVGDYKLDDPKFLRTYAVLTFDDPGVPPNWMVDISFRPDFGGTSRSGFGYFINGQPVTADSDTIFNVAYAGDGNYGLPGSESNLAYNALTSRHSAYISLPYYWKQYVEGCGKTLYWRIVGWPGYSKTGLAGPTYSNTIDCNTKVGVVSQRQDVNGDGVTNWTDTVIMNLNTQLRAGGWQPPE